MNRVAERNYYPSPRVKLFCIEFHPAVKVVGLIATGIIGMGAGGVCIAAGVLHWGIPLICLWGGISGASFVSFIIFLCFRSKKPIEVPKRKSPQVEKKTSKPEPPKETQTIPIVKRGRPKPNSIGIPNRSSRKPKPRPPKTTSPPPANHPTSLRGADTEAPVSNRATSTLSSTQTPVAHAAPSASSSAISTSQHPIKKQPARTRAPASMPVSEGKARVPVVNTFKYDLCEDSSLDLVGCPAIQEQNSIPLIGTYDRGDYRIAPQLAIVRLPNERLKKCPVALKNKIGDRKTEFYFMVYDDSNFKGVQRNYVPHPWLWEGLNLEELQAHGDTSVTRDAGLTSVSTLGIYEKKGVKDSNQDRFVQSNGQSDFNFQFHMEDRSPRLSPNTAKFNIDPKANVSYFYSLLTDNTDETNPRAIVTFSVLVHNMEGDGKILVDALNKEETSVSDIVKDLKRIQDGHFRGIVQDLLNT